MNNKKFIAAIAAGALALGCTIGGTVAWLTAQTNTITNVFTTSDIEVSLTETTGAEYQMVPGYTIAKNPAATVTADSEDCYLFVEVTKANGFDNFMTYEIAAGWTELTTGVYYMEIDNSEKGIAFPVLKDNQVVVKGSVTKDMMDAFDTNNDGTLSEEEKKALPTLSFKASASQLNSGSGKFTPEQAWANVANPSGTTA